MKRLVSKTNSWNGTPYEGAFHPISNNFLVSDPGARAALGAYPIVNYISETNRDILYSYRAYSFYKIPYDKYQKLRDVFTSNREEMPKDSKVYFFKDLETPSLNFTQMLNDYDSKRVRDLTKADVIVLPDLRKHPESTYARNVSEDLVQFNSYGETRTCTKDLTDTLGFTGEFVINSWWSRVSSVFEECVDGDLVAHGSMKLEEDEVLVAGGIMETLYHHIHSGIKVYTESNFAEVHSNKEPLNRETAEMIIKLLNSPTQEDNLMGATVFAESDFFSEDAKPYSYYIISAVGNQLSDYKSYKNVRNIYSKLKVSEYDDTPLAHLLNWYSKEGIELPEDIKETLITNIIRDFNNSIHYQFRRKEFLNYFNINITYKEND